MSAAKARNSVQPPITACATVAEAGIRIIPGRLVITFPLTSQPTAACAGGMAKMRRDGTFQKRYKAAAIPATSRTAAVVTQNPNRSSMIVRACAP